MLTGGTGYNNIKSPTKRLYRVELSFPDAVRIFREKE
jgi:hypothetical protein